MNLNERRRRREKLLEKTHITINKRRSKKLHTLHLLSPLPSPLSTRAHTHTLLAPSHLLFLWAPLSFLVLFLDLSFISLSFSNARFLFFIIFILSLAYHHLLSSSTSQNLLETTKLSSFSLSLSPNPTLSLSAQLSSFAVVFGLPESLIGFAPYFLVWSVRKV